MQLSISLDCLSSGQTKSRWNSGSKMQRFESILRMISATDRDSFLTKTESSENSPHPRESELSKPSNSAGTASGASITSDIAIIFRHRERTPLTALQL